MAQSKLSPSQFTSGRLSADVVFTLQDSSSTFQIDYSTGGQPALYIQENVASGISLQNIDGTELLGVDDNGITFSNNGAEVMRIEDRNFRMFDLDRSHYLNLKAPDTITTNFTLTLPTTDGDSGQYLKTDGSGVLSWDTPGSSTDHGTLTGLADDDHTQYALLAGRSGGQTIYGGTAASQSLILYSTSHATKGNILLNPEGGDVFIGGGATASTLRMYDDTGGTGQWVGIKAPSNVPTNYTLTLPTSGGSSGQYLKTDGSGGLSWDTPTGGGSSSGAAGAIQYSNGSGGFSAEEANLFYNSTSNQLQLAGGSSYNMLITNDNGGIEIKAASSPKTGALNGINVSANATGTVNINITNTNTGADANSRLLLTTASAGGDPFVGLSVGDATYIIGVDNSDSDKLKIGLGTDPSDLTSNPLTITGNKVGVSGQTSPTAALHLPAGTASAESAPLKLTSGTALTTPEDGALEYHASHLYFTIGSTRYQLDQQSASISDGDKGDITVASGGTVWTIDSLAVTDAKINDVNISKISDGTFNDATTQWDLLSAGIFNLRFNGGIDGFKVNDNTGQIDLFSKNGNQAVQVTSTAVDIFSGGVNMKYIDGVLRLYDSDNTHYIGLTTPATGSLTTSYTLTLPTTAGSSGQALTTNGSGTLTWTTIGGTGDVTGPGSSVNNRIVTFSGTTGKVIQDSGYALPTGAIVGESEQQTLTNKRIDLRVSSAAYTATLQPDPSSWDIYYMTGATGTITLSTFAGTPVQGNRCTIALKDNGTTRTISWNANYKAMGVSLPTATVAGKWLYINVIYYDASNYHVVGISSEA